MVSHQTHWGSIFFFFTIGVVAALHLFKLASALSLIRQEFGLTLAAGGQLFSVFNLVGMLLGVVIGGLTDRFEHKRTLLWALVLISVTSFWMSVNKVPELMLVIRLIEGFGFVAVITAAPSLIANQSSDKDRRLAMALWSCFLPIGGALAMLSAPGVLDVFGWRALWQGTAVLSLLLVAILVSCYRPLVRHKAPQWQQTPMAESIKGVIQQRVSWLLMLLFAMYTFSNVSVYAWLPTYLIDVKGLNIYHAGLLSAWVLLANPVGNLSGGLIMRAGIAPWKCISAAAIAMGLAIVGMVWSDNPDAVRYSSVLLYSAFGAMWPAALFNHAMTVVQEDRHRGAMNGLLFNGNNLGIFLGPPLIGAMVSSTGRWTTVAWLILPVVVMAAIMAPLLSARIFSRSI